MWVAGCASTPQATVERDAEAKTFVAHPATAAIYVYRNPLDRRDSDSVLYLDRRMYEKRIFPAINVNRSGTRREELLIAKEVLTKLWVLRKLLYPMDELEATEFLLDKIRATKNNADFFDSMKRG